MPECHVFGLRSYRPSRVIVAYVFPQMARLGLKYGDHATSGFKPFAAIDLFKFRPSLHAQVGAHKRSNLEHVRRASFKARFLIFFVF